MRLTRRRFLVTAAAAGVVGGFGALVAGGDRGPAQMWRGAALGGEARVALYGHDADAAKDALAAVAAEIERLEAIFSLYRDTSELSRLNRDGKLDAPSRDLVELLRVALFWRERTGGAFNPAVQPIWKAAAQGAPVTPELIGRAGAAILVSPSAIALAPGAALTLNGIAQGRIADRVTEMLLARGFAEIVVDAGELRLPGRTRRPVGIPAAKAAVAVAGVAIATSEPKSLVFDARTFRHHLIDPRTGESPRHWQSISVFAPTAETADALSTAFALMTHEQAADLASSFGDVAFIGADWKGRIRRHGESWLSARHGGDA
jgi:thiamine biosynthesis lipoprotein